MIGGGDALARGAKTAQFSAGGKSTSQLRWDLFAIDSEEEFQQVHHMTKVEAEKLLEN